MTHKSVWLATLILGLTGSIATAQGRRGGGPADGIPNAAPPQAAALTRLSAEVAPQTEALAAARTALGAEVFGAPGSEANLRAKVDGVCDASWHWRTPPHSGWLRCRLRRTACPRNNSAPSSRAEGLWPSAGAAAVAGLRISRSGNPTA